MKKLVTLIVLFPMMVIAQEPAAAEVAPDVLDKILEVLLSATGSAGVIAVVVEFLLRMVKSDKPLSIAHMVAGIVRKVAVVLEAAANLLDKVLPQRLK